MTIKAEVIAAYSDCNESPSERNLRYFSRESVSYKEAHDILLAAIPDGYNGFDPNESMIKLIEIFGEGCKIHIARESSVCLYLKPDQRVWLSRDAEIGKLADEVSFDHDLGMFRVWWD
jgi:hypothetical protein